ncbi:hypothetical protein L6172_11775 [Thalassospiraceae bacterium SW-3-3]|nr:hypothetical protein L6172_11775 [Thalassospiraceae bacterium SW-3-3]
MVIALDAIGDLEKACNSFHPQTVYFTDLSAILSDSGYPAQAKTVLTQALKRKPLDPKLLLQMGIFLTGNNEARQAVPFLKRAIFKDVLARHSGHIRAWHCLTLIDRASADHPSRQVMINKTRSRSFESIPDGQKELLLFGLAKNHMEHGEIDAAMKALNDGNRIKRRNIQYSPQTIENVLGITKAAFHFPICKPRMKRVICHNMFSSSVCRDPERHWSNKFWHLTRKCTEQVNLTHLVIIRMP